MRFTNTFTVLAASAFFASANCASVHEDLAGEPVSTLIALYLNLIIYAVALSRLQGLHAAVHARNVEAEPATITYIPVPVISTGSLLIITLSNNSADITTIVNDGTTLGKDIATLIKDLQASPAEASQPDAATIL